MRSQDAERRRHAPRGDRNASCKTGFDHYTPVMILLSTRHLHNRVHIFIVIPFEKVFPFLTLIHMAKKEQHGTREKKKPKKVAAK